MASLETQATDLMRDAFRQSEAGIQAKLDALIERIESARETGQTPDPHWLQQEERYHALLTEIEAALDGLVGLAPDLAAIQKAAADLGAQEAETLAVTAAGGIPEGVAWHWNTISPHAVEALVGRASNGSPLAEVIADIKKSALPAVRNALADGLIQGENPRETAGVIAGILGVSRARAETIARTETLQALREAQRQTYQANSQIVTRYVRLSAADRRTCPACWALHGTEYQTADIMPTHPNCRCVQVPQTKSWAELTGDDSLPDTRPAIESGETLFEALPPAVQKEILGPGRFEQYQGGAALADFAEVYPDGEWGPSVRVRSVGEA